MPEKHEFQGEIYYFHNGQWTDRNHIIVPMAINSQLNHNFGKKKARPIRKSGCGYNVWIRILPGSYGTGR